MELLSLPIYPEDLGDVDIIPKDYLLPGKEKGRT